MSQIEKWIAGKSAVPFNHAVKGIAPKAIKGGTAMPNTSRGAKGGKKGGRPKPAVKAAPLNVGTFKRKAKGSGPVSVPSNPVTPLDNTATNTTAGNTANGLHIHIHTNGGY